MREGRIDLVTRQAEVGKIVFVPFFASPLSGLCFEPGVHDGHGLLLQRPPETVVNVGNHVHGSLDQIVETDVQPAIFEFGMARAELDHAVKHAAKEFALLNLNIGASWKYIPSILEFWNPRLYPQVASSKKIPYTSK